jgi:isoquinoline 1-oxidoreductase beta subunit
MLQQTDRAEPEGGRGTRFRPTRRGFLIGAGATVGLVVGYALWPRRYPNGLVAGAGETLLGPWVKIGPDGRVTVPVPQAEMGQGIWSGFAQVVADELGAAWGMMAVEPAPWHPDYAHVGLANGTGALPPLLRDIAGGAGRAAIRRLNLHITGGSMSLVNYHDALRAAAAEARARLVAAAAGEWGVAASELDTADGFVLYKANRMAFADAVKLVDPDADAADAPLRPAGSRRLEGRRLPRLDLPPKVDGRARFGADVRVPGMVYAAIRHGPVGGATLLSATAPAGVRMVKGPGWVAAVGRTWWEAQQALAKVEASFSVEGRKAGPWMEAELAKAASGSAGEAVAEDGDVEAGLGRSPLSADYRLPFLAHACLEPMTATARVSQGAAEVWGPTQSLTLAHWQVADALGLESDAVTIHPTLLGGGFGRKAEPDAMVEAALIARAIGQPVQLIWSREEDLGAGRFRPAVAARLKGALGRDGRIAAWEARVAAPSVGASFIGRTLPRFAPDGRSASGGDIEGAEAIPYAIGAFRAVHAPVLLPVPLGFWRSVGHSFSAFLVESFIDELAAAAEDDPVQFRLKHLGGQPRHAAVLRAAAEAAGWQSPGVKGYGRGVALHASFGSIVAMVVEAGVVDGAIRIARVTSAIDCGRAIAPDSVRAQLEGAAVMGLSAAIGEEATFADGEIEQRNFHLYPLLGMAGSPFSLRTVIVTSGEALGGVGEPGLPPAAPALANALFAATGKRARSLPLGRSFAA